MQPLWDGLLHHLFGDTINCHCTALSGTWLLVHITSVPVQLLGRLKLVFAIQLACVAIWLLRILYWQQF